MKFSSYIIFTLLWATFVYDPVAHWVWGHGWIAPKLGALDFAGGLVVHLISGVAALCCVLVMGRRKGLGSEEMHPHNLAFSPVTLRKLVDLTGATSIGAEMDPSHLMWQGMDVVACIRWLGPLVFHAAAKDASDSDVRLVAEGSDINFHVDDDADQATRHAARRRLPGCRT